MGAISSPDNSKIVQVVKAAIAAATGTTSIPDDNTAPLSTEGTQVATLSITPKSASNTVRLRGKFSVEVKDNDAVAGQSLFIASVFRGSTLIGSVRMSQHANSGAQTGAPVSFEFVDSPATTSAVSYSVRVGSNAVDAWNVNRTNGSATALASSMANSQLIAEELRA